MHFMRQGLLKNHAAHRLAFIFSTFHAKMNKNMREKKQLAFAFEGSRKFGKVWERVNWEQVSFQGFAGHLIWFVASHVLANCQKKHLYVVVVKCFG